MLISYLRFYGKVYLQYIVLTKQGVKTMKNSISALLIMAAACVTGAAPSIAATIKGPPPPCTVNSDLGLLLGTGSGISLATAESDCIQSFMEAASAALDDYANACDAASTGTVLCQAELTNVTYTQQGNNINPPYTYNCSASVSCVASAVY
jgi:hypothetical protein